MKIRWAVFMLFCGSLLSGWIGYSSRPTAANLSSKNEIALDNPKDRKMQAGAEAHSQKWQTLAKQVTTFSPEERESFLAQVAPTDRGKALDALMSQIGPDTSDEVISMMERIMKSWAAEDFDAALAHCQKCPNAGIKSYLFRQLLEILVERDPDRTRQLFIQQKNENPAFSRKFSGKLVGTIMGKSANQMLDFLSKLPVTPDYYSSSMDFPKDFDFQTAADGIMAMTKAHAGNPPAYIPTNLIESWATLDPVAAQAWWVKNSSLTYNDWGGLFAGVMKHSGPEAATAWAVAKFEEPGAPREKMLEDLYYEDADLIGRAMPDTSSRDRFFTDVILQNVDALSNDYRFAISGLSSPQARLAALQKISDKGDTTDLYMVDDAQLQAWGLTRQQVELVCQPR